jgi:signal transduction histidine kinase
LLNSCNDSYSPTLTLLELLGVTALMVLGVYGLAVWVMHPVRVIAQTVGRFGPNSLGLRLRPAGPRDETRQLADEIDTMLDRLASGYDAQRRFAANASHELRTPLATQRALIEVSLGSALTPDQLALLARQLLATNERNERLVDGLLTLAETEAGLRTRSAVRLDRLVQETVDGLRSTAADREVELRLDFAPATAWGEVPLLERLASNLVGNAVKYNHPGGCVDIRVGTDGSLTVANTGPDVPDDQVAGLFEPFRRRSGERLDHGGGAGLGLTIARSIVAAHGGSIDARSNPGGGLVVVARLPTGG